MDPVPLNHVAEATLASLLTPSVEVTACSDSTIASAANVNVVPPQPQPPSLLSQRGPPGWGACPQGPGLWKEIWDLVVEELGVEKMVQRYPGSRNL